MRSFFPSLIKTWLVWLLLWTLAVLRPLAGAVPEPELRPVDIEMALKYASMTLEELMQVEIETTENGGARPQPGNSPRKAKEIPSLEPNHSCLPT